MIWLWAFLAITSFISIGVIVSAMATERITDAEDIFLYGVMALIWPFIVLALMVILFLGLLGSASAWLAKNRS